MNKEMLKELREKSGAGLQDCKKALEKWNGDMESAFRYLREQGLLQADSRENRETVEGLVFQRHENGRAVLVHLVCETDFAAGSAEFAKAGSEMLDACMESASKAQAHEKCLHITDELRLKLRENLALKDIVICTAAEGEKIFLYSHYTGKAAGIIRYAHTGENNQALNDFVLDLALQTVAGRPVFIDETEIGEKEMKLIRAECDEAFTDLGKPEAMRKKIIDGMVRKRLDCDVLLRQRFIKDESVRVGERLARFCRETGRDFRILQASWLAVV